MLGVLICLLAAITSYGVILLEAYKSYKNSAC